VNKTIKKEELNPNIAFQLISIQLECLISSLFFMLYFTHQAVIYSRLVFSGRKLQCRPTSIVLKFISQLVGTSKTFLTKGDIFSI